MTEQTLLGSRIRSLRHYQGVTLQELADKCECSKSLLSKIETGKIVPSVATLIKIAANLGTSVSSLLEEKSTVRAAITTWEESQARYVETEKGYMIADLARQYQEKKLQPFFFKVEKGKVKKHSLRHKGEEFIVVLEGSIYFQVGHVTYTLNRGDTIYFNASEEHSVTPKTDSAVYLDMFI